MHAEMHAASCEQEQGINVLIPIGGSGLRFAQAGLSMPKPMLKLAGRPMLSWVLDSLNLTAADTIFVGLSHEYAPVHLSPTHSTNRRLPQVTAQQHTPQRSSPNPKLAHTQHPCAFSQARNLQRTVEQSAPCRSGAVTVCVRAAVLVQACAERRSSGGRQRPGSIAAPHRTHVDGVRRTHAHLRPS